MMSSADQIAAQLVGDYILQSHWMATEKTKRSAAAALHAITYIDRVVTVSSHSIRASAEKADWTECDVVDRSAMPVSVSTEPSLCFRE